MNSIALKRHIAKNLCKKRPRKVFKVKIIDEPLPKNKTSSSAAPSIKKESKWREERARLQEAIKAGKQIDAAVKAGVPLSKLPPAPISNIPDNRTECPYCNRKFSSNAAERHIPYCKDSMQKNAIRKGNTMKKY